MTEEGGALGRGERGFWRAIKFGLQRLGPVLDSHTSLAAKGLRDCRVASGTRTVDDAALQDLCCSVRTADDVEMEQQLRGPRPPPRASRTTEFCVLAAWSLPSPPSRGCASGPTLAQGAARSLLARVASTAASPGRSPSRRCGQRRAALRSRCRGGPWRVPRAAGTRVEASVRRRNSGRVRRSRGRRRLLSGTQPAQNFPLRRPQTRGSSPRWCRSSRSTRPTAPTCALGRTWRRDFAGGGIPWQDATQMEPLAPSPARSCSSTTASGTRGRANTDGGAAALGYFVFSRPGLSDAVNFAHASLEADVAPHLAALAACGGAAPLAPAATRDLPHAPPPEAGHDSAHLSLRMRQPGRLGIARHAPRSSATLPRDASTRRGSARRGMWPSSRAAAARRPAHARDVCVPVCTWSTPTPSGIRTADSSLPIYEERRRGRAASAVGLGGARDRVDPRISRDARSSARQVGPT